MSKRLRGAVRAGHKGRALRPKSVRPEAEETSTPPPAPSSPPEASPSSPRIHESLADALQHHAELEAEARSSQAPLPEASAEDVEEDPRATDTVREPSLIPPEPTPSPPEAPSAAPESEAPPPAAESAKPASVEPVSSAPATTIEPAIKAAKELGQRDQESKEERVEETKAPASFDEEQKDEEQKEEEAPSEARAEETTQPPVSSAPSTKVEPAVRAAKQQATREPTSKSGKTQKKKTKAAEESKEPASESKAHRGSLSSLSGEFFQGEVEDSVPPLVEEPAHDDELEAEHAPPLSPEQIARRTRLRRIVAGVVAFAGVISLAVLGKALLGSKSQSSSAAPSPAFTQTSKPSPMAEAPKPPEPAKSAEVKSASVGAEEKVDEKVEEKAEEKVEEKADPASPADAAALKKETLSLLNRGLNKDAIAKGREAIAADPSDAEPYLYLGSALQTLGKWPDAIEVYSECVRKASRGPVHECRAMGGHK